MPFFLQGSYNEKMARKSFKLLGRIKAGGPSESETRCLLCADSSIMLQEIILCTDQAVYYHPRLTVSFSKYDFSSISAVTLEVVNSYSSVCLTISNGETSKLYVATKEAEKMADYIKSKLSKSSVSPSFSAADEISKFKSLLDSGAITEAEFEAKKKQLLGL